MIRIIAPTLTLLPVSMGGTGELIEWTDAIKRIYDDESHMVNRHDEFSELTAPQSLKITNQHMMAVVSLGGEVEGVARIFQIHTNQLNETLPESFPNRTYLDELEQEAVKTWADLESSTQKYNAIGDYLYINSSAAQSGIEHLTATELFRTTRGDLTWLNLKRRM